MARHFLGHASTHALQAMQRSLFISQSFVALVTFIASVGHFFSQMPQKMHLSISMETLPRVFLKNGRFSKGYRRVAGRDKTLRAMTFKNFIWDMINAPYS
jgi:hypothetical protein